MRRFSITNLRLPLSQPFRISRGVKTHADLVRVSLTEGGSVGRGECCPYPHYGETTGKVIEDLEGIRSNIENDLTREGLQTLLPAGAARNALDCALWDLKAKQTGSPVFKKLGLPEVKSFQTFRTVTIATPEKMASDAARYPKGTPLKIKLDQELVSERLLAIKKAAPDSQIMVDANEGWTAAFLADVMPILKGFGVVLIEQPIPIKADGALKGINRLVPVLADEACHTSADLPALKGKYDAINIKLDKTGGLTEALKLMNLAQSGGMKIMLGCMVSSSLSIAPISHLCSDADFIDLDGPLLLKEDPEGGMEEIRETASVKITHPWGKI